eukprot:1182138-Prorocentrum_minimum.AAC.4
MSLTAWVPPLDRGGTCRLAGTTPGTKRWRSTGKEPCQWYRLTSNSTLTAHPPPTRTTRCIELICQVIKVVV